MVLGREGGDRKKDWREMTRPGDQIGCLSGVPSKKILSPLLRDFLTTRMQVVEETSFVVPESKF